MQIIVIVLQVSKMLFNIKIALLTTTNKLQTAKQTIMRRFLSLLVTLLVFGFTSYSQPKQVSGRVFSAEDKTPIPGVSVLIKEAPTVGTTTNLDGQFTLKNVPANAKTLIFRFVGFQAQEVAIKGGEINVTLAPETQKIDEVVVTALGMKKSEKSVGYATSTVKSSDISGTAPTSVMSGLTGKVAGLTISTSGGTGTSQKVIVRGMSSFSGNQPLYIVDGVPIQNSFLGSNGTNQSVDFGNQAGDINPEDVESVTVLKGASASALYGSRAAAGVIIITTKKGKINDKISVTYNGAFTASRVSRTPQFQDMFGQGWPLWDASENGSWGPKLDGRMHDWGAKLTNGVYDSKNGVALKKPFSFVEDNLKNFYETGMEYNNNISIMGGGSNTSYALSYGNSTSDGIIPSNADKYKRNTFSFRANSKYNNFEASYDLNYVRKDIDAIRGGQGGATGATLFQELVQTPVDIDYRSLKNYNDPYFNTDNFYTWYAQNPYWVVANNQSRYQDDRVYGKIELSYQILKGLKATGRIGGDFTNARRKNWSAVMTPTVGSWNYKHKTAVPGNYEELNDAIGQIDATGLLQADYKLNQDFQFNGTVGVNYNQRKTYNLDSYLGSLNVPGWYSLENGTTLPTTTSANFNRRLIGALGQFDLAYKDWAFLGLSLRNDWSSTLPANKNSFFYWGTNLSVIVTDAIPSLKDGGILSFLKVRGGWGQTGNDAPTYRTESYFSPTKIGLGFGNLYLPLGGVAGLTELDRIGNQNLKPEITTEFELGVDARFFNNRLTLDAAYYNKTTKDQIISAAVAPETGYTSRTRNVGEIQNQGVEIRLTGTPVKINNGFEWQVGATFSKNVSEVKKLWDNVTNYDIASFYSTVYFSAKVGEPLGIFTVPEVATVTDKNSSDFGKTIVNASGIPTVVPGSRKVVGKSTPDFVVGFTNSFSYKGFGLNAVLDWREGGIFYSNTARMLMWNGNATATMFNERQPFLVPNSVKQVAGGGYAENDIPIMTTAMYNYYNSTSSNLALMEKSLLTRSFVKLRELSFSYKLPQSLLAKMPVKGVEISLIGRNLFMWTPSSNNFVDPESTNYGNDIASEAGEFSAAPTVRNFGGSLRITF